MRIERGLFVVLDGDSRQWLVPRRPIRERFRMADGNTREMWTVVGEGNDRYDVSSKTGCIELLGDDRLDACCFAGKLARKVYKVSITLG